jgi:hypothetical protein
MTITEESELCWDPFLIDPFNFSFEEMEAWYGNCSFGRWLEIYIMCGIL